MLTLQQLLAPAGKDKVEALRTLYEGTFVCAQRLISLNLKATRSIMENNVSGIRAMMAAQDVQAFCTTQSGVAHKLIQQTVGYAVDFNEIIAENQHELSGLLNAGSDNLVQALAGTTEETMMIDVVKAMLRAATDSRDYMLEIARQVDASIADTAGINLVSSV